MKVLPEEEPEGATLLEPEEREGLLHGHVTTREELNELEQENIEKGLRWIGKKRTRVSALDDGFLRELHQQLFGDVWRWAGRYRLTEKNIGVDPAAIAVGVRNLVEDARAWVEYGSFDPIEAAVRYHHRLVQIHCYPNGNGRHARIAADIYLEQEFGHPRIDWSGGHRLERSNKRRMEYIQALREADKGDLSPLLRFAGHSNV